MDSTKYRCEQGKTRDILQETIPLLERFPAGDVRKDTTAELKLKAEQSKCVFVYIKFVSLYQHITIY